MAHGIALVFVIIAMALKLITRRDKLPETRLLIDTFWMVTVGTAR